MAGGGQPAWKSVQKHVIGARLMTLQSVQRKKNDLEVVRRPPEAVFEEQRLK